MQYKNREKNKDFMQSPDEKDEETICMQIQTEQSKQLILALQQKEENKKKTQSKK